MYEKVNAGLAWGKILLLFPLGLLLLLLLLPPKLLWPLLLLLLLLLRLILTDCDFAVLFNSLDWVKLKLTRVDFVVPLNFLNIFKLCNLQTCTLQTCKKYNSSTFNHLTCFLTNLFVFFFCLCCFQVSFVTFFIIIKV